MLPGLKEPGQRENAEGKIKDIFMRVLFSGRAVGKISCQELEPHKDDTHKGELSILSKEPKQRKRRGEKE